jgi:hypothetical protein
MLQQPPSQQGLPGKQHSLFVSQQAFAFAVAVDPLFAYATVPATIRAATTPKMIFFIF